MLNNNIFLIFRYNLEDSNINDTNFDKLNSSTIPSVVLVKKYYGSRVERKKNRIWKLKRLAEVDEQFSTEEKYLYLIFVRKRLFILFF